MRVKQAGEIWIAVFQGHRAVGNPDTFMIEIHLTGPGVAGGFLGTSTEEKGSMEDGHLHFPGMVGNDDREEAGILVVHMDEIDALIRIKVKRQGFSGSRPAH